MGIFLLNLFLHDNNFANTSSNLLFLILNQTTGFIKQVIIIFKTLSAKKTIFFKKMSVFVCLALTVFSTATRYSCVDRKA